jgi:tungstate transport system ATP-binding protein
MGLRQRITLVLPKIGVFNTTVFKNVAYGLKIRGLTGSEVNQRVNKVLDLVRLLHKRNQNALTLSSGETQRMGIARALVIQPDVLLLDEPTAFVDIESRKIIEEIIDKMKFEDKTILITTHDSSQAKRLGNWILSIEDGKIQERSILPV